MPIRLPWPVRQRRRHQVLRIGIAEKLLNGMVIFLLGNTISRITVDACMEVWLKRNCWLYVIVCGSFSNVAQAHGEDILVSIYADLLSIVLCMTVLLSWRRARAHRVAGLIGCIAGTICGNLAVSRLPYTQYEVLITAVGFIAPIAGTTLAMCGARRHESDAKRR